MRIFVYFWDFLTWWLHMVVVKVSSLVAILAQWIVIVVDLWSGGWVIPTPIFLKNFCLPMSPKILSRLCGELICVHCVGHVSGEE